MATNHPPLIVIVGPTASGKTALAIDLAERFNGEIISADSRAIYKYADIGTAKPSRADQARVPHWGLDLVEPGERFTAADFKLYAEEKIQEIRSRDKIPMLVGGTGLYVDAVIFDYQFGSDSNKANRQELEQLSVEELQKYCHNNNILLPENIKNKRHLVRVIERGSAKLKRRMSPVGNSMVVGITTYKHTLRTRIENRVEQILTNGVVEEAILLGNKYGWDNEAMTGNYYPIVKSYMDGTLSEADLKDKITTLDWRLAKRQLTWLRRNPYIYWGSRQDVQDHIEARLNS